MMELRIGRHAVQTMLHHALASQPSECCGILGGKGQCIELAEPVANESMPPMQDSHPGIESIPRIVEIWMTLGFEWRGIYFSCSTSHKEHEMVRPISGILKPFLQLIDDCPFKPEHLIEVALILDIKGRLETHAFQHAKGGLTEVPLVMQEELIQQNNGPDL